MPLSRAGWKLQSTSPAAYMISLLRAEIRRIHARHISRRSRRGDLRQPRSIWSLSNAFTSAFKELDLIPQFKTTAKLGELLEARFSQSS
jgi:hypothetical protein